MSFDVVDQFLDEEVINVSMQDHPKIDFLKKAFQQQ